jgi:hypothetical protein
MNRDQAYQRLKWIFGKKAYLEVDERAATGDDRIANGQAKIRLLTISKEADAARDARRLAVLAADPEYQKLKADALAAYNAMVKQSSGDRYRYTAGSMDGIFFSVKGRGDTFSDLFESLEKAGYPVPVRALK